MPTAISSTNLDENTPRSVRILEHVRLHLNKILARKIAKTFEADPAADFERVVNEVLESYRHRLSVVREKAAEAVFEDVSNVAQAAPNKIQLHDHQFSATPTIILELAPSILTMLNHGVYPSTPDVSELLQRRLPQLIDNGRCLFSAMSRMVVQLSDDVVVKCGPNVCQEEFSLVEYVARYTSIPVPRALGLVTIGKRSYMFSTFIPGETLESRWLNLTDPQKISIRGQLNDMVSELRRLPYSSSTPLGSLSIPHICKDVCMSVSISPPNLQTISQFHDFLVSRPARGISSRYLRWLRSILRDDYHIVLTHGDLHPRNIMVVDEPSGDVRISGIIDWEMGGWYPEYWEMYKALNTRGARDETDWWDSLPETILGYDREVLERRVVEQAMQP